ERLSLARLDRLVALQELLRAHDDRDVDHLAVERERAASAAGGFLVELDDFLRVGDFLVVRRVLLVHDRDLAGMDAARAVEAEAARAAHHRAELVPVAEARDGADEA